MSKLTNIFTIIFVVAALASVFQLGSLTNGISSTFASAFEATVTPVKPSPKPTKAQEKTDSFAPERIVIPGVGIDLLVFSVPLKNGTWEVLPHVANYAEGTSLINPTKGNVGIYAHDRLDGFTRIKELLTGSDIIVYGLTQKATYKVITTDVVAPSDVSVFDQTDKPILTLITCDGLFSEKRYMVQAELIKIEPIN